MGKPVACVPLSESSLSVCDGRRYMIYSAIATSLLSSDPGKGRRRGLMIRCPDAADRDELSLACFCNGCPPRCMFLHHLMHGIAKELKAPCAFYGVVEAAAYVYGGHWVPGGPIYFSDRRRDGTGFCGVLCWLSSVPFSTSVEEFSEANRKTLFPELCGRVLALVS